MVKIWVIKYDEQFVSFMLYHVQNMNKNHFSSVEFVILCRRRKRNGFGGIPLPHHQPNPSLTSNPESRQQPSRTHTPTHTLWSQQWLHIQQTKFSSLRTKPKYVRHLPKQNRSSWSLLQMIEENKTLCLLCPTVPCLCGPFSGYKINMQS